MITDFFQLMSIGVNGQVYNTTISEAELAIIKQQNHEKAVWIAVLAAILIGILYFVFAHSKVKENLKKKYISFKAKKARKKSDEELDRLHRIKEKNKRK